MVCKGLRTRGHDVILMAGDGSTAAPEIVFHTPSSHLYLERAYRKILFQWMSMKAVRRCDVVLNFGRTDYLWAIRRLAPYQPLVARFGNPLNQGEIDWLLGYRKGRLSLVSVSDDQRRDIVGGAWTTIYNSVDCNALEFNDKPDGYLAFLGRLSQTKGVEAAIDVAERCGMQLKIAGNIPNSEVGRRYFAERLAPRFGALVEWIGEIGDEEKSNFLGRAHALLMPTMFREPFGIVMAEALACGTPVIALKNGSVPEVVDDGVTGFVCNSVDEMVVGVRRSHAIDRRRCRRACEQRFEMNAMVDRYEDILLKTADTLRAA